MISSADRRDGRRALRLEFKFAVPRRLGGGLEARELHRLRAYAGRATREERGTGDRRRRRAAEGLGPGRRGPSGRRRTALLKLFCVWSCACVRPRRVGGVFAVVFVRVGGVSVSCRGCDTFLCECLLVEKVPMHETGVVGLILILVVPLVKFDPHCFSRAVILFYLFLFYFLRMGSAGCDTMKLGT